VNPTGFGREVLAENSKTKRERFIPIDATLYEILDSIERKGDYVITNGRTGEGFHDIDKAFRAFRERAGIPSGRKKGLTFRDCRHIAIFRLVKMTDIVTASRTAGHSDVKMTMRYCHSSDRDKREATEKAAEGLLGKIRQKDANASDETAEMRASTILLDSSKSIS
jgi:integrase